MIDIAGAVRFDEYNHVDVLQVRDVEVPAPGRGEVQVREAYTELEDRHTCGKIVPIP